MPIMKNEQRYTPNSSIRLHDMHTGNFTLLQMVAKFSQEIKQFEGRVRVDHIMFTANFKWLKMYHGQDKIIP
jgi:hypothetical protein